LKNEQNSLGDTFFLALPVVPTYIYLSYNRKST